MSNRRMFDGMPNSGNALGVPVGRIHEHGEGSIYVISEPGDPLLAPKRNLDRLSVFNSEGATDHGPIGDLEVGPPVRSLSYGGGRTIYLWKITPLGSR